MLSYIDRDDYLVASRTARFTFGVVRSAPVEKNNDEHMRRKHLWERNPTGDYYVPGYFETIVRRVGRLH